MYLLTMISSFKKIYFLIKVTMFVLTKTIDTFYITQQELNPLRHSFLIDKLIKKNKSCVCDAFCFIEEEFKVFVDKCKFLIKKCVLYVRNKFRVCETHVVFDKRIWRFLNATCIT